MFILICLLTQTVWINSIQVPKECDEKWKVDYINGADFIKQVFVLDLINEYEEEDEINSDCFYNSFSQNMSYSTVILEDGNQLYKKGSNRPREKERERDLRLIEKTYRYRSDDMAFVILLPYPDVELIHKSNLLNMMSRFTKAMMIFVFYNIQLEATAFTDNYENKELEHFMNDALSKLKYLHIVGIILGTNKTVYFTHDMAKFDSEIYYCGIKFSLRNFDYKHITKQSYILMKNYPVRMSIFAKSPSSMEINKDPKWSQAVKGIIPHPDIPFIGRDAFMIADIISKLQFRPVFISCKEYEPYGERLANGTVTGVLGDIVNKKIEISGNSRFITSYGHQLDYYFLGYNHFDRMCAFVSKNTKIPLWINVLMIYSLNIWILLLLTVFLTAFVQWVYSKMLKQRKSFFEILFNAFFFHIVPVTGLRNTPHILLATGLFISIIFVPIFQGNIRSSFTKRTSYPEINSLEIMDNFVNKIYIIALDKRLLFTVGVNELFDKLDKKISVRYEYEHTIHSVLDRKTAYIGAESETRLLLYSLDHLVEKVHMVKECPREYFYSFIGSTNFPWADEVESTTLRLIAAGLPNWYTHIVEYTMLVSNARHSDETERKALSLDKLNGPYIFYFTGIAISVFVFLIELYIGIKRNKQQMQPRKDVAKQT